MHYGVPDEIVVDQGGEFKSYFNNLCEQMGIETRIVGAGTAWQHGVAERHGGLLGTMWRKLVYEHDIKGEFMSGFFDSRQTPEQAVFGRSLKFTEVTNRDDDEVMMGVLGRHGFAWKASQVRTAAKMALLERDVTVKVRRAMLRQAPTVIGDVCPGTRVYFWSAHPMKGRKCQDSERWRGPATVVAKESQGSQLARTSSAGCKGADEAGDKFRGRSGRADPGRRKSHSREGRQEVQELGQRRCEAEDSRSEALDFQAEDESK